MRTSNVRTLRSAMLFAAAALFAIAHASAQPGAGSVEVGLEAGPFFFLATGARDAIGGFGISFEPHIGYSISEEFAVGATAFLYRAIEGGGTQPAVSFGGGFAHGNYRFSPGSTWSPYIGMRLGAFVPRPSVSQFVFGIQTGVQYFVSPPLSINGQLALFTSGGVGLGLLSSVQFGLSYHLK